MSEKLTDGMSDNEYIATKVMSIECWHEVDFTPTSDRRRVRVFCEKCGDYYGTFKTEEDFDSATTNPAYDSPNSPRQLLDEVVQKAVERFGMRDYMDSLGYVLTHETDATKIEMSDAELGFLLLTAPPETICRAVRSLYEGEK